MALILEIRDPRGVVSWHRLDALPLAIGRAPSNDIILDDPYLDARHATITRDESGEITIADLGSVNGTHVAGASNNGHIVLQPGAEVRVGRTVLRFRALDEQVPPALVDDRVPIAVAAQLPEMAEAPSRWHWLLTSTRGRWLCVATMIAAFAFNDWLGETERSSGSDVLAAAFAATTMAIIWAALWSIAGRGTDKRPHFLGHMAVVSLALIALLGWTAVNGWLTFLFPDRGLTAALFMLVTLAVVAALVAGHLAVTSSLSRRRRWRAGIITAATMAAMFAVVALLNDDDKFTDVPKFDGDLKPLSPRFVPTRSVDEFVSELSDVKDEVDEKLSK
jgi:pSer/pThr/pTyr-binding forkhead associated (FHA) protein